MRFKPSMATPQTIAVTAFLLLELEGIGGEQAREERASGGRGPSGASPTKETKKRPRREVVTLPLRSLLFGNSHAFFWKIRGGGGYSI